MVKADVRDCVRFQSHFNTLEGKVLLVCTKLHRDTVKPHLPQFDAIQHIEHDDVFDRFLQSLFCSLAKSKLSAPRSHAEVSIAESLLLNNCKVLSLPKACSFSCSLGLIVEFIFFLVAIQYTSMCLESNNGVPVNIYLCFFLN